MFTSERHDIIIHRLNTDGKVRVKDLALIFEVSEDLIRKDLKLLEGRGICKRVYGGAISANNKVEANVNKRLDINVEQKTEIAKKALPLIQEGEVVYLDESTTNLQLAKLLATTTMHITVISNMIDILQALMHNSNIKVIGIGGEVNGETNAFEGSIACYLVEKYTYDRAFVGAAGIDKERLEATTAYEDQAILKEKIIDRAKKSYLMLDDQKFSAIAPCHFSSLDKFEYIVLEDTVSSETKQFLKKNKLNYK